MQATNSIRSQIPAPIVFRWLMIICGVIFLGAVVTLPACFRRTNSIHWPTTEGVINAAGLKTYLQKAHVTPSFEASVSYSYNVDGVPRVGTKINFADAQPVFTKEDGLTWLDRNYPVGKRVTVYYDPRNPDLAVLHPGAKDLTLIWSGWMGASALAGMAAFICYRSACRQRVRICAVKLL